MRNVLYVWCALGPALGFTAGILIQRFLILDRLRTVLREFGELHDPFMWTVRASMEHIMARTEGRPERNRLVNGKWWSEEHLAEGGSDAS